jgi:hypothetical protein
MKITEIFGDPFNPDQSIQLNNRYWPSEKNKYLSALIDAENFLREGRNIQMARVLHSIKSPLLSGASFRRILRRIRKLHQDQFDFGFIVGKIDLSADTTNKLQYEGSRSREAYDVRIDDCQALDAIAEETKSLFRSRFGNDLIRMNSTVRYARPDERVADITHFGPLSDFHNDEHKGVSGIVYLSDVKEENGAFQFIPYSNKIPRSIVLAGIHQYVCFDLGLQMAHQMEGLPLEFRSTPAIGNFLDDWKVKILNDAVKTLEGPVGSYIIFNGQYLIHRGGKPKTGERTALFFQPEGLIRLKARTAWAIAASDINFFRLKVGQSDLAS